MYSKIGQLDYRLKLVTCKCISKLKKTGCVALVLCLNISVDPPNICWAFSIYLEAIAILPQLVLLQQSGNVDNLTGHTMHCIFSTGFVGISHSPVSMDGYVTLYADFFYYYFIRYSTSIPILSVLSFTLSIIIITQAL
uniref:ER lumen protein-retaining receptor n=1 Tax=Lactuca sativa TaxID=4236 RepID=A0A9R1UF75_LACSA|nr:hypothetical protein LSAT_V11C900489740 [Lactuca sativa]